MNLYYGILVDKENAPPNQPAEIATKEEAELCEDQISNYCNT
jgi:hypothetical protein